MAIDPASGARLPKRRIKIESCNAGGRRADFGFDDSAIDKRAHLRNSRSGSCKLGVIGRKQISEQFQGLGGNELSTNFVPGEAPTLQ
jgi:hypothetical protein